MNSAVSELPGAAPSPAEPKRTICIVALSPIIDDPRVRRHGDAFREAGWDVVAVGLPGGRSTPPAWPILTEPPASTRLLAGVRKGANHSMKRVVSFGSRLSARVISFGRIMCRIPVARSARDKLRRLRMRHRGRLQSKSPASPWELHAPSFFSDGTIRRFYNIVRTVKADIYMSNDWHTLPIVARVAQERGAKYAYDTHEFATEEYAERPSWSATTRPLILALEGAHVTGAAVVSTVSGGIASRMAQLYRMPQPPLVIRNIPTYQPAAFRPTADRIQVLYHGLLNGLRGLEAAIDSVKLWRPEFHLTIRGQGTPEYLESLRRRIDEQKLSDRVRIVPPVPMTSLIAEASAFDIGLFSLPGTSQHYTYALPNKLFEYVMAGLCLCVSDLPDMAAVVREFDLGPLISAVTPEGIAEAINSLNCELIDGHKRRALAAARELNWKRESARMVDAYERSFLAQSCTAN